MRHALTLEGSEDADSLRVSVLVFSKASAMSSVKSACNHFLPFGWKLYHIWYASVSIIPSNVDNTLWSHGCVAHEVCKDRPDCLAWLRTSIIMTNQSSVLRAWASSCNESTLLYLHAIQTQPHANASYHVGCPLVLCCV